MSGVLAAAAAAVVSAVALCVVRGRAPHLRLTGTGPDRTAGRGLVERTRRATLARAAARRGGSDVVGMVLDGWTANLRAGLPAEIALRTVLLESAAASSTFGRTAAGVTVGADIGAALVRDADSLRMPPDRRAVVAAAACWSVSATHGGRLADALDRVADSLRAERVHVAHVRAQLAGPRATARLLAALPLLGLLMASGLGLDPVHSLVADRYGRWALLAGLLLDGAGLAWTAHIARAAERAA